MKRIGLLFVMALWVINAYPQIADSAKREIKLQGALNFRDIGGYPTKDGRHVKWGKIYRSAELSHLTDSDLDKLRKLSIVYVADFRGPYEVKAAPDKMLDMATRVSLPAGSENTGDSNYLKNLLQTARGDSVLVPYYSNISSFKDRYKPLFRELLEVDKDGAVLFHCSAGKDRTGIAAALILAALNVDENIILEDYLASNYYRRNENEKVIKGMVQIYKIDENVARGLMSVRESYLRATFKAIRLQYGSIETYLDKVMEIQGSIELLRNKFLE